MGLDVFKHDDFDQEKYDEYNDEYKEFLNELNNAMLDWVFDDGKMKLGVKFINKSNNDDPKYAKEGDSGFDLRAYISEDIIIQPLKRAIIPTGLYFQVPINYEIQVRPRSGLALKNGIFVLNTPGTVDSGYRGEIQVILFNTGDEPFIIKNGDRIAQAVIAPVQSLNNTSFRKVETLDDSERGNTGFGSSGIA